MEKDSALYQLMDTRMNGVMNGIVSGDGEYQAILRESDIYSGELDRMDLSKEIRLLIDRYVSEQNALGSRFGMLAYLLGFSDCKAMFLGKCLPTDAKGKEEQWHEQKTEDFSRVSLPLMLSAAGGWAHTSGSPKRI